MEEPVLHVIVVGFHHKKGCQVEFSYPPLIEGNTVESHEIPEEWKHIPSLALPDGAHNFVKDTVYFVLPGRKDNLHTVYGVSCYRQMDAKNLINKTADVTRSTVQKSVCVLSRLPLFGLIKAKLELITHAYFDERDFSQVSLLEQTFNNLNSSLTQSLLEGSQVFLGLSVRELVTQYKHKIIVVFKLLMLERRVLVFGSPVESLCHSLLSVLSLFPGMLESGLRQACNQWSQKKLSPTLGTASLDPNQDESEHFMEIRYHSSSPDSPLAEVMGHMHNSALNLGASGDSEYSSLDIGQQDSPTTAAGNRAMSEAPESPSIPRDAFDFAGSQSGAGGHTTYQGEAGGKTVRGEEEKLRDGPELSQTSGRRDSTSAGKSRSRSCSSNDSEKLSVHAFHRSKKEESVDEETKPVDSSESPLAHVENITHIEAVQEKVSSQLEYMSLTNKDDNGNALPGDSHSKSGHLSLADTKHRPKGDEIIEELDSPESISKIDREDCFSWEQDRLQLSIDHEFSPAGGSKPGSRGSSASRDKEKSNSGDSPGESESGRESVSSDSTTTSSPTHSEKNSRSLRTKTSDQESPSSKQKKTKVLKSKLSAALHKVSSKSKLKEEKSEDKPKNLDGDIVLPQDNSGYPLAIFTKGSVCYPYLSLQYHDILTDVNIRSFVIGATNVLFKQRRQLIDAVIEVDDGKVEIRDRELQRQLSLTTADLRFAEYLVKTVTEDRPGTYDGTEWEGSDEWIRAQFRHYLNSLLSSVWTDDSKMLEDFGSSFISAWKTTHNFHTWFESDHPAIKVFPPGHPFQGNLNMTDVRMRFNHTLQNSERGRKINAAVVQTGKYVVQTGKVVGGALTSAKSAVSGWFSSWRSSEKTETSPKPDGQDDESPTETPVGRDDQLSEGQGHETSVEPASLSDEACAAGQETGAAAQDLKVIEGADGDSNKGAN
ncbi:late secretory pathway protein AVL9 homolog [Aplysia californica]|uniref:Late secretory pathway protein AVL9 homolog n=1 Tax=Aplysia californica TaxID=6500 RepID=A0ABM0K1R2_APLCA|nr:late secretory pathway protein AVL9 homolog [Aplysia californica]